MATFTTKYDLGDELYFLKNNKIHKGIIVSIYFDNVLHKTSHCIKEKYTVVSKGVNNQLDVSDLFKTEEELIQSLKS